MNFNTYLFDFDGTLVDSMPTYVGVMMRILEENNIAYPEDIVKIITPLGYKGTAEYFIKLGLNMSMDEIIALMNSYASQEYQNNVPAKDNVADTLIKLKERGADLNILTASPHNMLDPCIKRLGISHLFTNVWSCEDFATTKADVNIYKMAAEKIGKPMEEILFVDDNYNAVETASHSGIKTCGIYDKSSHEYTELIKSVADFYVKDFSELLY